jgi:carbohydrate diacid regulator
MASLEFIITPHFGRTIVTQVMSLLGRDVSLSDARGQLIASYDPDLVGQTVAGADIAIASDEPSDLSDGSAVGFPITYDGSPVGVLVIHADHKSVKELIPVTKSLVELLVTGEAEQKLPDNLDQLLWQLFHSHSDAEREQIISEARLLGIDLSKPRFVVLLNVPKFSEQLAEADDKAAPIERIKEKITREVSAVFPTSPDNTITYFGRNRFLLLKDASKGDETVEMFRNKADQMIANLDAEISIGIGGLYLGIEGLLTSYREADTALRIGMKLEKEGKAYFVDDLGLYVVFGSVSTEKQIALSKRLLAPLLKEPDLLKTLRAYFDQNLNLTKAAKELHIHRNTLIYRLGKIKELLGLDPELFEEAVQLRLALTLLELE